MQKISKLYAFLLVVSMASMAIANDFRGPTPFETYDKNGDGFISKDEFNNIKEQRIKQRESEGRMMKNIENSLKFEDIDKDKDGKISKVELLEAQMEQMQKNRGGRCR